MAIYDRGAIPDKVSTTEQYYLDKTPERSGEYQVHRRGCRHLPEAAIYLGSFTTLREAVFKARRYYVCVSGCKRCCE